MRENLSAGKGQREMGKNEGQGQKESVGIAAKEGSRGLQRYKYNLFPITFCFYFSCGLQNN